MQKEFQTGDVVTLKSGTRKMTVREQKNKNVDREVTCNWHDTNGCLKSGDFLPKQLQKIKEN